MRKISQFVQSSFIYCVCVYACFIFITLWFYTLDHFILKWSVFRCQCEFHWMTACPDWHWFAHQIDQKLKWSPHGAKRLLWVWCIRSGNNGPKCKWAPFFSFLLVRNRFSLAHHVTVLLSLVACYIITLFYPFLVAYNSQTLQTVQRKLFDHKYVSWYGVSWVDCKWTSEIRSERLPISNTCLGEKLNVKWSCENWMTVLLLRKEAPHYPPTPPPPPPVTLCDDYLSPESLQENMGNISVGALGVGRGGWG